MTKISVYDFVMKMYQGKEITIHGWYHDENGNEKCRHATYTDKYHNDLYHIWKDYNVMQFKVTKKGCIDIIADNF